MPRLTRWFIKTGFVYLALSMAVGLAMLVQPVLGLPSQIQTLRPVYFHYIFIGWVTQLIMGVGYWMFPKYTWEQPRGNAKLAWTVYVALNLGLIFRTIGEPLVVLDPLGGMGWTLALAGALLLVAGWGYIVLMWPLVKER